MTGDVVVEHEGQPYGPVVSVDDDDIEVMSEEEFAVRVACITRR